jgi:Tol biopolymer transport system component
MHKIRLITTTAVPKLRRFRGICLLIVALAALALGVRSGALAQAYDGMGDALVYWLRPMPSEPQGSYYLYDPGRQVATPLDASGEYAPFAWNANGRLAFMSGEGGTDVFVLDTKVADASPVNISNSSATHEEIYGWSPDGRYLAFSEAQPAGNYLLRLWDGESVIDVLPDSTSHLPPYPGLAWRDDGWLAFHAYPPGERMGSGFFEIYLWDGETTTNISQNPTGDDTDATWSADGRLAFRSVRDGDAEIYLWDAGTLVNVSQNPARNDFVPVWSVDGRLAFLSEQDDTYALYLWDGAGVPDRDSVTIIPNDVGWMSYPRWTQDGRLIIPSIDPADRTMQIYAWDGDSVTNISQNPGVHNGGASWASDGKWAFVTVLSSRLEVLVRDADNRLLLRTSGQYTPLWSWDGYLAFCDQNRDRVPGLWTLNVWDGTSRAAVAQGYMIAAQWQSGAAATCTFG